MYGSNFGQNIPSKQAAAAMFGVNTGTWEGVKWSLYDSTAYPAAGVSTLAFFAQPLGQGTGFGGGVKTLSDTNMNLAGQIPSMQQFIITDIEVLFQPTTPTVAAQMPAAFGNDVVAAIVNDEYIFRRSGNLQLAIGSKAYVQDAPLWVFPSKQNFEISAALSDTTTAAGNLTAAGQGSRIAHGFTKGMPYILGSGSLNLTNNQNFSVTLGWPEGVQAITNPARVFVRLNGWLYRAAQ